MTLSKALWVLMFASASTAAMATGTPEEQEACRPDVRRFCSKLPANASDTDFLVCLENNRDILTKKCLAVLIDHNR
jgi:hypothetical protein